MNYKLWDFTLSVTFVIAFFAIATVNPHGFLRIDHTIFPAAAAASGTTQMVGELSISDNRIHGAPPATKLAAGFLTITNGGKQSDKLISVKFDGAEKSQIHEMKMQDGVMKMRQLDEGIEIPAGKMVVFKPGGLHLMFVGLNTQLEDGQSLPVKLVFSRAGEITLNFPVSAMKKEKSMMKKTGEKIMKGGDKVMEKGKEIIDGMVKEGKEIMKNGKEMMSPKK